MNVKEEVKQLLYNSKITSKIVWDRKLIAGKISSTGLQCNSISGNEGIYL